MKSIVLIATFIFILVCTLCTIIINNTPEDTIQNRKWILSFLSLIIITILSLCVSFSLMIYIIDNK